MSTFAWESDEFGQAVARAVEAIQDLARTFTEVLDPVIKEVVAWANEFHARLWAAYREDGMPYGESEEGFALWIEILGAIHRAREELLTEHQWNVAIAEVRQRIATRNDPSPTPP